MPSSTRNPAEDPSAPVRAAPARGCNGLRTEGQARSCPAGAFTQSALPDAGFSGFSPLGDGGGAYRVALDDGSGRRTGHAPAARFVVSPMPGPPFARRRRPARPADVPIGRTVRSVRRVSRFGRSRVHEPGSVVAPMPSTRGRTSTRRRGGAIRGRTRPSGARGRTRRQAKGLGAVRRVPGRGAAPGRYGRCAAVERLFVVFTGGQRDALDRLSAPARRRARRRVAP